MKSQELRTERAKLHEQYTAILSESKDQPDGLTADQRTNLDKLDARMVEMKSDIDRIEAHEARSAEMSQSRGRVTDSELGSNEPTAQERAARADKAMRNWFLVGSGVDMSDEDILLAREFGRSGTAKLTMGDTRAARRARKEFRAQSVGTDSEGGYTGPEGFVAELEAAMLQYGGMRQANTRILRTATGNVLPWPTYNDTGNAGALLAENTQDSEQDVVFSELQLDAYKYTSKIVRVSKELMQDSAFDLGGELGRILGERLGRIHNTHQTTGTGTAQPNGVATAAVSGLTAASATVITWIELIQLEHSVDPAYRAGAQYMFNDATLSEIRQLLDADSRPLWQPGLTVGAPDSINGYGYVINQDVADTATTAKAVLFGDFSKYIIRDVLDIDLIRMNEQYADYHQVAFVAISRMDSDLLNAGTNPIKCITML